MNVRTLIVGTLAIVSGLSAMVLVQALRRNPSAPVVEKGQIIIATADFKTGEVIQEGMIKISELPKTEIPEDAFTTAADVLDRAALGPIDNGDMLRKRKLSEKGVRGINVGIPKGMRLFTITTPSFSSSLAGFILPHNRVDILLTINMQGSNENETGGTVTTTLLQNVEIMAVHTAISTPSANKFTPEEARSVTVLVSPDDAALLDLGQNKGTLHLTLRNMNDNVIVAPKAVTMERLNIPGFKKATPPPVAPVVVEAKPPVVAEPPPFVFTAPEPEPEPIEVKLQVRTLRGTSAGQDVLTLVQKAPPAKNRQVPQPPAPGSSPTTTTTSSPATTASANPKPLPGKADTLAQAGTVGTPGAGSNATGNGSSN